jgi:hypothetical protein
LYAERKSPKKIRIHVGFLARFWITIFRPPETGGRFDFQTELIDQFVSVVCLTAAPPLARALPQ